MTETISSFEAGDTPSAARSFEAGDSSPPPSPDAVADDAASSRLSDDSPADAVALLRRGWAIVSVARERAGRRVQRVFVDFVRGLMKPLRRDDDGEKLTRSEADKLIFYGGTRVGFIALCFLLSAQSLTLMGAKWQAPVVRAPSVRAPVVRAPVVRVPELRLPDRDMVQKPAWRAPQIRASYDVDEERP